MSTIVSRPLLAFSHSTEGEVRLTQRDEIVEVLIHWPFDRLTDEWIDINLHISMAELSFALRAAAQQQPVTLKGICGGFLRLERRGDSDLVLSALDSQEEKPVQLSMGIPSGASQLDATVRS